jgi:catechol 2,3-dioxygenase-like lactoylglutathione lyase family enzyme
MSDTLDMATETAFRSYSIVAFVATSKPALARRFYRDTLGLCLVSEDEFALAFDAHGTMLRVSIVKEVAEAGYTVLGWQVPDIVAAAKRLQEAGVRLLPYPGMGQDKQGVWTSPSGARVAWFKDPDGNTLSLTELPAAS